MININTLPTYIQNGIKKRLPANKEKCFIWLLPQDKEFSLPDDTTYITNYFLSKGYTKQVILTNEQAT